ncbi:unnamed protein product [Symbiodinium pilosum]|uniref:Uncharacterized protein n=1 Tax=Symbiodinium pilosum TaxID=2952 RepID=A0A812SLD6_SYMPI|nr:unnamed protein product [Symbiodinium pilosum]
MRVIRSHALAGSCRGGTPGRVLRAYSTDLQKDYKKIFGEDRKPAVETVEVEATEAAPEVDVGEKAPSVAASAVPTDPTVVRRFPAGSKVVIKGLTGISNLSVASRWIDRTGAVELNGQEGLDHGLFRNFAS